jgi:hypothetical protein
MAEIPVVVGPGGGRHTTAIATSVETFIDLTAFAGKYVTLLADQNCRLCMIPLLGTYTLSMSGALTLATSADKIATPGACVGAPLYALVEKPLFVSKKFPRLMIRASTNATTYLEICDNSDGLTPA